MAIKKLLKKKDQMQGAIVMAGGGTGGHLYPAIAIARALQKKNADLQIHFVGARGGLEEKIVPRENFPLHTLAVGKLHPSVGFARFWTVIKMPVALWQAWCLLRQIRPQLVVGVGGYASGPFLLVAAIAGVPTAIWEPNAFPGMANRWLAPWVDQCLVVFPEAQKHLRGKKFIRVGLPVRREIADCGEIAEFLHREFHLLVFGGSQGAHAINKIVTQAVKEGGPWLENLQIVHQTGPQDYAEAKEIYHSPQFAAHEFLHDMEHRYRWADLILCRAGASTVAEICACRRPAIFVPLPTAADNHQQKNAEVLVRAGAAEMILQPDFTSAKFKEVVMKYKQNLTLLTSMVNNLREFQSPHAAEKTAEILLEQMGTS